MALTPTIVREHIETDLSDAALTRLINDAESEVTARFGDDEDATVDLEGQWWTIRLPRPAESVTSVSERRNAKTSVLVDADDYELVDGGRTLVRHVRRWSRWVTIVYTPKPEAALRERVALDLVHLSITYGGFTKTERVGDYQQARFDDYLREREHLLQSIQYRRGGLRFA